MGMPTDPHALLARVTPAPTGTAAYGEDPEQVYDVRLPDGPSIGPTVVVVHGGFWKAGFDRAHAAPQAQAFADAGHPTAVLEYRRTGMAGGGFPGTLEDVQAGLAAIADDPRLAGPLVAVGHSAGGHLALWAACQPDTPLRAVIALGGCVDLSSAARMGLGDEAATAFMGGGPDEVPERYAVADPALLVPAHVPVTLVHGCDDDVVPVDITGSYAALATESGSPAAVELLPGVGHYELIDPEHEAFEIVRELVGSLGS